MQRSCMSDGMGVLMFSEQPSAEFARFARANVWRNANSLGAWATLCGDRACRMPKPLVKSEFRGAQSHDIGPNMKKWCKTAIVKRQRQPAGTKRRSNGKN